jgi:fructokinase
VAPTPIIVQKIRQDSDGNGLHGWSWTCPGCGSWLPSYRAVTAGAIDVALGRAKNVAVFFFDRVSRGAVRLAKEARSAGALVVFEPSANGSDGLMDDAVRLSHIVKYSHTRAASISPITARSRPPLEVVTHGGKGLKYRGTLRALKTTQWRKLKAFPVKRVIDPAGAGDWCTAGLIHVLGQSGSKGFTAVARRRVEDALFIGQALAAWNCGFYGARGGMGSTDRRALGKTIAAILKSGTGPLKESGASERARKVLRQICPKCRSQKKKPK